MDYNTIKSFSTIIKINKLSRDSDRDENSSEKLKSKEQQRQHFVGSENSTTEDEIEKSISENNDDKKLGCKQKFA